MKAHRLTEFPPVETQHPTEAKAPEIRGKRIGMRRPCSILVLCLLLGFASSPAIPAEDVPETAYDESEGLPYEGTPPFSIMVPLAAVRTTQEKECPFHLKLEVPSLFAPARVHDTDANRLAEARVSLALLCTLLC
jgi:hypothetical protein